MKLMQSKKSIFEKFPVLKQVSPEKFPKTILIIPDGNGRWAKNQHKFVLEGHKKGAQVIKEITEDLSEIKEISALILWAFSSDNWKRSEKEIKGLMTIIKQGIQKEINNIKKRNGRFVHIGRKDRLSKDLLDMLTKAEEETRDNKGQIVCSAIDFGGEDQNIRMVDAARKLDANILTTDKLLWQLRDGKGLIKPADLLIRTSGEKRTSDVGWLNGASTELYFIDKLFPDITTEDIVKAIVDFSKRERRFGARLK